MYGESDRKLLDALKRSVEEYNNMVEDAEDTALVFERMDGPRTRVDLEALEPKIDYEQMRRDLIVLNNWTKYARSTHSQDDAIFDLVVKNNE